jgi:phospholipid/cholesterol/gamma-HCH transport system substrate-binding protein
METHARYARIGIFSLAVIAAAFVFVYWLRGIGGLERTVYRIRFEGPVSGVVSGSPVLFNGIRVGEVTGVSLDRNDPNRTTVFASVDDAAPVRADTKVDVETQGLLGAPALTLTGGSGPPLRDSPNRPPTLEARDAAQDLSTVARGALRRFDSLIGDNATDIHETLANLKTFTGALARNSDRIDNILTSLEKLGGGGSGKQTATVFELVAPSMAPLDNAPDVQLTVSEPTAVVSFDTQKILYRSEGGETMPAEDGQWGDTLPKILQAKVIHTFENANYMRVVRAADGFPSDHQLLLDLRRFDVSVAPERVAEVEFTAKIVDAGKVSDGRMFRAAAPVRGDGTAAAAAGLNAAFGQAAIDLVTWVASSLASGQPSGVTNSVGDGR